MPRITVMWPTPAFSPEVDVSPVIMVVALALTTANIGAGAGRRIRIPIRIGTPPTSFGLPNLDVVVGMVPEGLPAVAAGVGIMSISASLAIALVGPDAAPSRTFLDGAPQKDEVVLALQVVGLGPGLSALAP